MGELQDRFFKKFKDQVRSEGLCNANRAFPREAFEKASGSKARKFAELLEGLPGSSPDIEAVKSVQRSLDERMREFIDGEEDKFKIRNDFETGNAQQCVICSLIGF